MRWPLPSSEGTGRMLLVVTAVFGLLGLAVAGLMTRYWIGVLQPRLEAEARSQADILARSQAPLIAQALRQGEGPTRVRRLVAALDEVLLLRDPQSDEPFFESVALQVDYDAVHAERGSLDLHRGEAGAEGFPTEVGVYDPESYELLAVARLRVSDRFFEQLSGDLRRELLRVSASLLAVLFAVWMGLVVVLRQLQGQALERLRAEQQLSLQRQQYQRLVDNLSAYFVYAKDAEGRPLSASDSVRRVLGLSPQEFLDRHADRLVGLPAADAEEHTYEVELTGDGDALHDLELTELPVRDAAGAVVAVDGIARDVTRDHAVQGELRFARDQAEAANRAKSLFLANMSHEIRTPLNAIVASTGLALKTDLSPDLRRHLERIRGSARLLTDLIEDILDLSRIEAGTLEIQRVEFDLDELLSELSDLIAVRVEQAGLEILFSTAPDLKRRLRGDPVRLKQVLLNLLGNAVKFTSKGEIVVDIRPVATSEERTRVRFSVRDSGVGIPREHLDRLFEPFTQVDSSLTRRYGGAGLGLAISRRLVGLLGGELEVDSAPGQGSTFSFTAEFELPRGAAGPRRLSEEFHDVPVLVADDNDQARSVLGSMLRSLSCRVTEVASGEAALAAADHAAAEGAPFRMAVLDWKMPGLDGAEAASRLTHAAAPVPCVLVTAYDREEAVRRAAAAGVDVVLHKPISPSALHDAVLQVLRPGSERETARGTALRFSAGQHVLLVEDNAINREVAHELLALTGLRVSEAHNGREALQVLETQAFDLVLMDIQMPELDGLETVRALRARPRFADLPVVAMTAHAMLGDRERFLEAGMSDYVSKPIEERELFRVLARWLKPLDAPASAPPPPPAPPTGLPALALDEGLRRASGNRELYYRLLGDFRRETADLPTQVRAALARSPEEARGLLHTLKGSAATLGAQRLAAAASTAERELRAGARQVDLDELEAAHREFQEDVDRLAAVSPLDVAPSGDGEAPRDTLRATGGLARLRRLVTENNLAALPAFEELAGVLGQDPEGRIAQLQASLEQLDFGRALKAISALEHALASGPASPRVLVAEDDPHVRALAVQRLRGAGARVDEAEDGERALELFEAGGHAAALLDIELPGLNGFELAARIREREGESGADPCRLVAASSHDDDATRRRALDAGFDAYQSKPFAPDDLIRLVLGGRGSAGDDGDLARLSASIAPLVPQFLEDKRRELQELEALSARGDASGVQALSHRLNGSFGTYGFERARQLCRAIEVSSAHGREGQAADLIGVLRRHIEGVQVTYVDEP